VIPGVKVQESAFIFEDSDWRFTEWLVQKRYLSGIEKRSVPINYYILVKASTGGLDSTFTLKSEELKLVSNRPSEPSMEYN
jgi:hypothetical protein